MNLFNILRNIVSTLKDTDIIPFSTDKSGKGDRYNKGIKYGDLKSQIADYVNASSSFTIKRVEIGDWDMNADTTHDVAHGLSATEWTSITQVFASIVDDTNVNWFNLHREDVQVAGGTSGYVRSFDDTNITLWRTTSGRFDTTGYATPPNGNRGYLTFTYIPD